MIVTFGIAAWISRMPSFVTNVSVRFTNLRDLNFSRSSRHRFVTRVCFKTVSVRPIAFLTRMV